MFDLLICPIISCCHDVVIHLDVNLTLIIVHQAEKLLCSDAKYIKI